jgi:hypothetical protein
MFNLPYQKSSSGSIKIKFSDFDNLVSNTVYPDNLGDFLVRKVLYALQVESNIKLPATIIVSIEREDAERSELYKVDDIVLSNCGILLTEGLREDNELRGNHWLYVCEDITSLEGLKQGVKSYLSRNNNGGNVSDFPSYIYCSNVRDYKDFLRVSKIINELEIHPEIWCVLPDFERQKNDSSLDGLKEYFNEHNIPYEEIKYSWLTGSSEMVGGNIYCYRNNMQALYDYFVGLDKAIIIVYDLENISSKDENDLERRLMVIYWTLACYSVISGKPVFVDYKTGKLVSYISEFMSMNYCTVDTRVNQSIMEPIMVYHSNTYSFTRLVRILDVNVKMEIDYFGLDELIESYTKNLENIKPMTDTFGTAQLSVLNVIDFLLVRGKSYNELDYDGNFVDSSRTKFVGLDRLAKLLVGGLSKYLYGWKTLVNLKDVLLFTIDGVIYVGVPVVKSSVVAKFFELNEAEEAYRVVLAENGLKNLCRVNIFADYINILQRLKESESEYEGFDDDEEDMVEVSDFEVNPLSLGKEIVDLFLYHFFTKLRALNSVNYFTGEDARSYLLNRIFSSERYNHEEYIYPILRKYTNFSECYRNGVIDAYGQVDVRNNKLSVDSRFFGSDRRYREIFGEGEQSAI